MKALLLTYYHHDLQTGDLDYVEMFTITTFNNTNGKDKHGHKWTITDNPRVWQNEYGEIAHEY